MLIKKIDRQPAVSRAAPDADLVPPTILGLHE
jgi:hypothetical protein